MNPRQMQQMMRKMGIQQQEIDATEVIIKTADKEIVITEPNVSKVNMMGTSVKTPTTVANVAPLFKPKREMATATDNSKKLLAPIMAAGQAISWVSRHFFDQKYPLAKIK